MKGRAIRRLVGLQLVVALMLAAPIAVAAPASRGDVVDAYSAGFDMWLEALRAHDITGYSRVPAADSDLMTLLQPYAVRPIRQAGVFVLQRNDTSVGLDATDIINCRLIMPEPPEQSVRLAVAGSVQRTQSAVAGFDGVQEVAPGMSSSIVRYGWCENDDQPFLVTLGAELPGRLIGVGVTTFIFPNDPNPCEVE